MSLASRIHDDTFNTPRPLIIYCHLCAYRSSKFSMTYRSTTVVLTPQQKNHYYASLEYKPVENIYDYTSCRLHRLGFNDVCPWPWPRGLKPLASHTWPWRISLDTCVFDSIAAAWYETVRESYRTYVCRRLDCRAGHPSGWCESYATDRLIIAGSKSTANSIVYMKSSFFTQWTDSLGWKTIVIIIY